MPDKEVNSTPEGESSTGTQPSEGEVEVSPSKEGDLVLQLKALPHKQRKKILANFASHGKSGQVATAPQLQTQVVTASMTSVWSAPLPPPQQLEAYNTIIPGGAERILALAEKQSAHRIDLENFVVKRQVVQSGRGQIFGLIIGVLALVTSVVLTYLGAPTAGGSVGVAALSVLAVAFLTGKGQEKSSRDEKRKAVEAMEKEKSLKVT